MNSRVRNLAGGGSSFAERLANHHRAPSALPSALQERLLSSLERKSRQEFHHIISEPDPKMFQESLLVFAHRQEDMGNSTAAAALYDFLSTSASEEALRSRAGIAYRALQGHGPFAFRAERIGKTLAGQVANPSLLGGMVLAGGIFQTTRLTALSRLLNSPAAGFWTRGMAAEGLAWSAGYALEFPAFVFGVRGLNALRGIEQDWSATAVGSDLLSGAITLFALKSAGSLSRLGLQRLPSHPALPAPLLRLTEKVLPQTAMFSGILAAQAAELHLRLREPANADETFANSLLTLLHFNIAGRWVGGIGEGRWARLHRRIVEHSRAAPPHRFSGISLQPAAPSIAGLQVRAPSPLDFIQMMSAENGSSNGGAPKTLSATSPAETSPKNLPIPLGPTYDRFREPLGRIQADIQRALSLNPGEYLWRYPTYLQAAELYILANQLDSQWGTEYRNSEYFSALGRLKVELHSLMEELEALKPEETPLFSHPPIRNAVTTMYRCANGLAGFLTVGHIMGLEQAREAVEIVRKQIATALSSQQRSAVDPMALLRQRPWMDPLRSEDQTVVPAYEHIYTDEPLSDLEIPGEDQRVLLIGNIPDQRAILTQKHWVEIRPENESNKWEFLSRVAREGNLGRFRAASRRNGEQEQAADYLEAYDVVPRNGPLEKVIQEQILAKLKPGGIAYLVNGNALALQNAVEMLTQNRLADVLSGAIGSPLPVPSERYDANASNYVFIQRLKEPK